MWPPHTHYIVGQVSSEILHFSIGLLAGGGAASSGNASPIAAFSSFSVFLLFVRRKNDPKLMQIGVRSLHVLSTSSYLIFDTDL